MENELIDDMLAWKQPADLIAARDGILARNTGSMLPQSFPFFERPDFLLFSEPGDDLSRRLSVVSKFVSERQREADRSFCHGVRALCEYFSTPEGRLHFDQYAERCCEVFRTLETSDVARISDQGFIEMIRTGWLLDNRELITRYGHEAVALSRIGRTAHHGGGRHVFDEVALSTWSNEISNAFTALLF